MNISVYRESYKTQHVLTGLIEEWRKIRQHLLYLDRPYGPFEDLRLHPHDLVIGKLAAYGFDKNMICFLFLVALVRVRLF